MSRKGSEYLILFGLLSGVIAFMDIAFLHQNLYEILAAAGIFLIAMGGGMRIRGF